MADIGVTFREGRIGKNGLGLIFYEPIMLCILRRNIVSLSNLSAMERIENHTYFGIF